MRRQYCLGGGQRTASTCRHTTGVADGLAIGVSAPERGGLGATVCTGERLGRGQVVQREHAGGRRGRVQTQDGGRLEHDGRHGAHCPLGVI